MELCEKKPQRCTDPALGEAGDWWEQIAVAADSKLVVSVRGGKRTYEQTRAVGQDAHTRLRAGHLPAIVTEAFARYEAALLAVFGRQDPATGRRRRPVRRWRQGLADGQVQKSYKGGRGEGVAGRAVHGKARLEPVLYLLGYTQINPSVVARHNGTSRLRNQRKVCQTWAFSNARRSHGWMSWLSVGLYNVCRPHSSLIIKQADQVTHLTCGPPVHGCFGLFSGGRDHRRTLPLHVFVL